MLSLQVTTRSKARLAADDLEPYREGTVPSSIPASLGTGPPGLSASFGTGPSGLFTSIVEDKSSILSLIKEAQEFDLLCRQISSQLCEKSEKNLSFALHKNEILRKTDHVFVSHQKMI